MIQKAAAVIKVSALKMWVGESWSNNLFTNGLACLKTVGPRLLEVPTSYSRSTPTSGSRSTPANDSRSTPANDLSSGRSRTVQISESPTSSFYTGFFSKDHDRPIRNLAVEIFGSELVDEVNRFKALLTADNNKLILSTDNTKEFWYKHKDALPKLSKIASILLNINSSSACVERFFSLCGFISNKRNQNIETDMFITRCFLRANFKTIKEIKKNNN